MFDDLFELMKDGAFSSREEFNAFASEASNEELFSLVKDGAFSNLEEFNSMYGDDTLKKKDEPMESTSEDGSLDSSEEAPEALFPSPEQQAVKDEEILQAIQQGVVNDDAGPFEREANQAALTDGRGQQWDGVPFNEQEARIKKEMREVEDASMVERDLMEQEAEALELDNERAMVLSTPEVDRQLSEVNSQLVGLKEEEVVEKLQDLFKGRGFTFQTIGKGFSRMRVRTTDGLHSIDISLNNYRTSSDVAESAELQAFLRTHFNPTPFNENQDSITKAVRAQEMRDSERWNEDGTRSTVKFMSYEEDGVHKVAPTLFPKSTVQRSSPREEDWVELGMDEAITEAERRNEVFTFDSQEEAEAFAEGSWKGINSVDLEGQKYYNQYGRDYISDNQAFDNYSKAKETRLFLEEELAIQQSSFFGDEGQYDGLSPDEQEAYGEYFRKDGSLRGDAQDIINALDKEEANLWNIIDSENYMEVQDNFDAYLEKQHQESAQQAANINYEAMAIEDGLNNVSLNEFGITLDQLSTYQPKDEAERVRLNEVIEIQNALETKKELAALQYETALTYFDAKANKEIGVEFSNNLEGWWVAVSDGFANGQAGNVIMNAAMGIYGDEAEDMNRAAQKMTDYMNSVDGRQSRAMSRFNSAEDGFGREVRSALRRDPAEVIATWAGASLAQILPYGWKIIPSFIATGAAAGATVGATGLVTGPGGVLTMGAGALSGGMYGFRAGYAMTNLVLEYTNGVLDAGRELKYNMNDPEEAGLALQDPNVWERGRERGLKRGIPIALMDFLMTGLAGKVFKPIAVASKGRKLANYTAEALTLAPAFEGAGEFLAQLNVGDEVSMKEIIAEAGGSIGMSTPFSAVNIYKSTRGNYNQKIAENLMNMKLMASERASDKQIQSWSNRMLKLGKITTEQNQRILENIGLRKEAQEILDITGPSRLGINKKVQTRLMELLDIRAGLDATTNSRSIFSEELAAVNKEIAEIGRTNELSESPAENINFDFGKIGKRTTVPSYRIGNTMYSKTQFLSYIDKLSLRKANKLMKDSEVVNDEETSILLDEKLQPFAPEEATQTTEDAIQESSPTEVDVQEQSTDGAAVGKGDVIAEVTEEITPEDEVTETEEVEEEAIEIVDKGTKEDVKAFQEGTLDAKRKKSLLAGIAQRINDKRKLTKFQKEISEDNDFEIAELQGQIIEQEKLMLEARDLEESLGPDTSVKKSKQAKIEGNISINKEGKYTFTPKGKAQRNKVVVAARKAAKAIKKILPKTRILLHESNEEFLKAVGRAGRAEYLPTENVIHVNLSSATETTMAHEVFHAVFLNSVKTDARAAKAAEVMMLSVRKSLKDGSALAKKIDAFAAKYTGKQEQFQNEERLAELIGILASSKDYKQLSKPAKNVIIEFFKDLALRFGIELETGFGKTDESVIDLMNTIARKTREGREIEESDVEALNEILPKDLTPEEYIKRQTEGRQQKVISDVLDVNELEVVSKGGSSRIVYMHPDGKNVIKVAKNPKGLEQNLALGFGDVNMLGTFVPELEEQGLDYIIIENVPRNDTEVNKFLKPLKEFTPQDFKMQTSELQDAMTELGLDDFRNYNLLWNDFTATRNWGMRENGEFVLVDEGALDDSIHFSSEVKAWSKEEWGEVLSRRRENKKKPAPRQQMDERSAAVVRKGRLYGMNMDSGYFPRTASVEQIRKAFGPMGFGVRRAKDGGFGRGGGVYLTLNGRKFTPPSYRGRRQQQEEVMPPSPEDSMVEVITRGRAEGYSEASIREVLKSRGHKVKDIKRVMAATVDSFSDVRVPFEFGNIVGGMPAGIRLFQQIQSEVDSFKAPTVKRTGVRMTPFVRAQRLADLREANPTLSEISDAALLRRFPRRGVQAETVVTEKTPAEVREKALEILRDNSVFQEQSEQVQMELVIAMDRALGITANRSVSKEIAAVRSSIVQRNRKGRELQAIKRQLRNLIRTHIPTSKDYSQAAINRLVRATAAVTEDNYRVQVEKVLQVIEKQRENMRAKVLKKLLTDVTRGARKTITDTKKNRRGSLDIQGQSFAEIFKKALTLAMASEAQQEKAMEEFRLLAEELETDEGIVALAKSASGETLTSKEDRLVNIAVALDLVKNLPSMSLEEVENLANDYAVAASMSRQELSATRKRRALETDTLRQKVTDSLRMSNPEMFHEDGSFIKDANERRALLDDVREYWVEGKGKGLSARLKGQVKAAKTYVEIYKWKSGIQMVKSMFDSLKHLGTFMNSVNDTLYEEVFNRLNRMDNNSLKGYFKQQDFLRSLGYDAVLEQLFDTEMYQVKGVRSTVSGKKRNESFSKDQLLRLYALSLNPIQNRKLEAMGFTRVKMIEIEEYLGKDVTGFADKVVAYLSNEYYEGVNDVYRDVNDVNLNYVENYFPTMTTQSDVNPKQLFEGDFNGIFNAESAPALRNRNDMTSDINLKGATFTSALESHVKTMEHYKAYASDTKKLNAIFNTNSVDGTLAMLGVKTMVKQSVNNAINPNSAKNALNASGKIFNTLQTKFTSYALAFRLVQIGKQMTSFINAFENYSFRKSGKQNVFIDIMPFLMDYAAVMAQPRKYIKMATEMSPTFRYRLAQGVKGDLAGLESGSPTLTALENRQTRWAKFARGFKKTGAAPTIVGDIMGVMGYMANYRRNIKNGMSEEKAVEAFNEYNQTQQTRRPSERAILQQNSNFIVRGFTMFGSTPILYINNVMQASTNILRGFMRGGVKGINQKDVRRLALNLGAANAAFVAMSNLGLLLRGDDEERKEAMRQIRNAMLGLNLVYMTPFVGATVKGIENYMTGNRRPADMGVNPFISLFNKWKKAAKDDKEMEAMLQTVIEIGIGAQLAPLQALIETAGNLDEAGIKEIYDIIGYSESYREKAAKKGYRPLLPYQQELKDYDDKIKKENEANPEWVKAQADKKAYNKKVSDYEKYGPE